MEILVDKNEYQAFLKEDILYFKYLTSHVTKEFAEIIITDKLHFLNSKTYPTIIDATQVKNFDSDARKLMGTKRGIEGVSKCAIITKSKTQNVMVNFFMKINKPSVPTKMFHDYDNALEWLKE